MREHMGRFRGRAIADGKTWVEGYLWVNNTLLTKVKIPHITNDDGIILEVDPETVCECTGLEDKNGMLIFEGDVVEGSDFAAEDGYGRIIWDTDTARFAIVGESLICDFDNYYGYELEIIGNIHDNPELLE